MSGVRLVDGIVDSEQWLEYLEGEPKFARYMRFNNCAFNGEHILDNTIVVGVVLNNCTFGDDGTLFDFLEGSSVKCIDLNNCEGVNKALESCWSDMDRIFKELTIVIND